MIYQRLNDLVPIQSTSIQTQPEMTNSDATEGPSHDLGLFGIVSKRRSDQEKDEVENKEIVVGLSLLLANSYMLYLKTHNYHWNVKGPQFVSLHQLFMNQYTELAEALDQIAERIRTLGAKAPATFLEFSELTSIRESRTAMDAAGMIEDLLVGQQVIVASIEQFIPLTVEQSDYPTTDLLTKRMQVHQSHSWMLKSLQEKIFASSIPWPGLTKADELPTSLVDDPFQSQRFFLLQSYESF